MRALQLSKHWTNPASVETLNHAWWTVQRNSVVAPCRDIIDFADYDEQEKSIRVRVRQQLARPDETPVDVEFWSAPRSRGVCRFVCLPDIVTRVALQSLGLVMSEPLNSELAESVVSRPSPVQSATFVEGWYSQWSQYFARVMQIKDKSRFVIVADFASFFDSINADLLVSGLLRSSRVHKPYVETASQILRRCSYSRTRPIGKSISFGLPQLYDDIALLLGNYFLKPFDDAVLSNWASERYARWLDDFVLGVQTASEAWAAISHLSAIARSIGLNLNPHKTRVISSAELDRSYLFSKEHKVLDSLEIQILLGRTESVVAKAQKRFTELQSDLRQVADSGLGDVLLRRIYRLGALLDDVHLLRFAGKDLIEHPNSAGAISHYIATVSKDTDIASILAKYLAAPTSVYQTIEVGLLTGILRRDLTSEAKKRLTPLARAIISGNVSVQCDASLGIAVLLLQRCAGKLEATRAVLPLKKRFMAVSGHQSQRFTFVALCCALLPTKVTGGSFLQAAADKAHLLSLYRFLQSRDFEFHRLITPLEFADNSRTVVP